MFTDINISQIFVFDQDEALDFYVGKLGLEVNTDQDLGFMRWLTVNVPGHPERTILLERPGPPTMDEQTAAQVRELVSKGVMGGWHYKVYGVSENARALPPELSSAACLVLLDSRELARYLELRNEKDRARDGIILYSHEDLDIDGLNESGIVPENLLFAPPAFDEKHLHRCLVSIIFRRFLKEMVREKNEAAAQLSIAS